MTASEPSSSLTPPATPSPPPNPSDKFHGTPPLQHYLQLFAAASSIAAILILRRQSKLATAFPDSHRHPPVWQKALFYGGAYLSFSGLAHDYTGKSIYRRTNERIDSVFNTNSSSSILNPLPEQAQRTKQLIKEEKERRRIAEGRGSEVAKEKGENVITKIWMGGEKEGWQVRRMEEEKKALGEGKGYGDLIAEQVYEVFGWGKKKEGKKEEGKKEGERED